MGIFYQAFSKLARSRPPKFQLLIIYISVPEKLKLGASLGEARSRFAITFLEEGNDEF